MSAEPLLGPEPLTSSHHVTAFDCGVPSLNSYLIDQALADQRADKSRTLVAVRSERVVAYCSLAAGSVDVADASGRLAKGQGHQAIPVVLLGRLAVDGNEQGRGLGSRMLLEAAARAAAAAEVIGARALLVQALDEQARSFYLKHGFEPLPTHPLHLVMLMKDIRKTLGVEPTGIALPGRTNAEEDDRVDGEVVIEPVETAQLDEFRGLLREWFAYLVHERGIDMGYQSIDAELAKLPGAYGPPKGGAWLAHDADDAAVGCIALRPTREEGVCELKRLYVKPASRGSGIGRQLTVRAIDEARAMGYRLMRLDTGTFLDASRALYASLGFVERSAYYDVPPDVLRVTVFMELSLVEKLG